LVDDAKSFLLLLACLSLRFRCVAYDWPRGNGDEVSLARYRHEDFVHDFFAVLDQVGAQEVLPLGYSFGSTIVLKALQAQPNRFRRAVLLSGFAQRRLAPAERLLAMMARYWPGPLRNLPLRKWVLQSHHAHVFNCRGNDVWKYYLQRSGAMPMAALARRALVMDRLDLRDLLPRIQQDILLVCGDGDPLVSKKCETELLTGLRNSARVELANCGHLSIYTHPELLAEVVGEYFGGC
jgi:pimeloyl-ACP methyl ester carboxylesterase